MWWSTSCPWLDASGELTPDEPPAAEPAAVWACSSWPLSSLTRFSRFRSLSITRPASGPAPSGAFAVDAALLVIRSMRRAHFGGRSLDGMTHATLARRQLEQGDNLSQRTLRLRHATQLRSFEAFAGAAGARGEVPEETVAFSDGAEAEPPVSPLCAGDEDDIS